MRRPTILILTALATLGLVLCLSRISFPQSSVADRIVGPIAESPLVWLDGNRRSIFRPENDLGPVPDSLKLENVTLTFKLTEDQQAHLAALLEHQQDRASLLYHHWLTPEQFAGYFGPSPTDVSKVVGWLQSQGFTITRRARSRLWVSFSGTAAQVQSTFHTEIHNYSVEGKSYYGNASEPAVPAALVELVQGITSLDNYGPKPHSVSRRVEADPNPEFTSYLSGKTVLAPGDFAVIYDLNALYNLGIDGAGQSIAVMGQTDLYSDGSGPASDVTKFRSVSGLPANAPQVVMVPGVADPGVVSGDINEASLDVEWAGAVAKNAAIIFVNGGSSGVISNALPYAIDQNLAPVITLSYGNCEANWSQADRQSLETLGQQANAQGQTVLAASGDFGAADCDNSSSTTVTSATHGLAVDLPASSPFVTGMGGSEFNEGVGNYWLPAPNGVDVSPSALAYIPEMVWNDTSATNGLLAGGGGVSSLYAKPSWQTGAGVPQDGFRDVPDLAMNASPQHDPYVICVQGSCVDGYRSSNSSTTPNVFKVAGGTSVAAPTFAAMVALVNQHTGSRQGNINQTLYFMAGTSPEAFHDITTGNNKVPCTAGSTDCPNGGLIGYSAGPGYDQASGLGSVDAYNLVTEWNSSGAGNLPAPTLTAPADGATGVVLSPTFNWTTVSGNAGYRIMIAPSPGDLAANPATSTCAAPCTVSSTGTNANSFQPSSALAPGNYYWQVQALEPSTGTGLAAWSKAFSFTTTGGTLSAPTLTAPAKGATGVSLPPTFTWTAVAGNAGYRILIATAPNILPTDPSAANCGGCTIAPTTTANSYTPAASLLSGGTSYYWQVQALAPSGSGQIAAWSSVSSFTTVAPDFSLSVSPISLTIAPGGSGTSTLSLTPLNNFSATPTFTCSASGSLVGVTCSVGAFDTSNNTATITVTASSSATAFPVLPLGPRFGEGWGVGVALLTLLLIQLARRPRSGFAAHRRHWQQAALGALLAILLIAGVSCGGGSSSGGGGGQTSPPPESGTVIVTGTSTSITHTASISVSVS